MLEVSPVRAFSDNYIWLIRAPGDPAGAAVVDPGDARPAEDALDREGLRLSALFEGTPAQIVGIARPACAAPGGTRLHRGHDTRSANLRFAQAVAPANPEVEATLEASRELRSRDEPTLPSTIGLERRINPFLRCREPAVRAAAMAHAGRPRELGRGGSFVVIRSWKDRFR